MPAEQSFSLPGLISGLQSRISSLKGESTMPHDSAMPMGGPSSAPPEALDALKEAGVPDPQKAIDALAAKGFKIEGGAGLGTPSSEPAMPSEPSMSTEPTEPEGEFGDELVDMPMPKARDSAASFAAEKFGLGKKKEDKKEDKDAAK